jgi:hypothetical protein
MAQLPTWAELEPQMPGRVVERVDTAEKKVYIDPTKDQIEAAPDDD